MGDTVHQRYRVLFVDDDPFVRKLLRRILTPLNFELFEADDSLVALSTYQEHPETLDLLITDLVMPKLDGPTLAKQLKNAHPALRVLYMSGYERELIVSKINDHDAFLQKPFTSVTLRACIEELLQPRTTE